MPGCIMPLFKWEERKKGSEDVAHWYACLGCMKLGVGGICNPCPQDLEAGESEVPGCPV